MKETTSRKRFRLPTGTADQDVIHAALDRGFVTEEEVETARNARERDARKDVYRPTAHYLVESGAMTLSQANRLADHLVNLSRIDDLPGYCLLEELGSGSMGQVFRATQLSLDRTVAVKILSRRIARNKQYVTVFAREVRLAAKVNSPLTPRVYEAGVLHGQHYLVMEFVDGESMAELLSQRSRFTEAQALHVAAEVCLALDHLHRLDVLHRDVKPHNIVADRQGQVKLIDLGLCLDLKDPEQLAMEQGSAVGTPSYASPEQIRGKGET
ncbi:MAG: serine/threonine protein kinase, partial [Planctomycetales bacterium]